jgi:soluble P-type ATPase
MMIEFEIPEGPRYAIEHLVFDYNGTLAVGGRLRSSVPHRFSLLAEQAEIHVVTADTFGVAARELNGLPCSLAILPAGGQVEAKAAFVRKLGATRVAAFGNGRNDQGMLETAAIGIALVLDEGASTQTLASADVVCTSIESALDLFLDPKRLVATLRS